MKRWIIFILLSILLGSPAVSIAAFDTMDAGKATLFSYPFIRIPIGDGPNYNNDDSKWEENAKYDEKREKEKLDKKVDDAIKKAWEEK